MFRLRTLTYLPFEYYLSLVLLLHLLHQMPNNPTQLRVQIPRNREMPRRIRSPPHLPVQLAQQERDIRLFRRQVRQLFQILQRSLKVRPGSGTAHAKARKTKAHLILLELNQHLHPLEFHQRARRRQRQRPIESLQRLFQRTPFLQGLRQQNEQSVSRQGPRRNRNETQI